MLQLSLISKETLINFFDAHNIPLQGQMLLSCPNAADLLESAGKVSALFVEFVVYTLLADDFQTIHTNFTDYNEAYEMYEAFVVGFHKQSVNN